MTASTKAPAPATPVPNGLKRILPEAFEPSEFDFVIGRGKQIKQLPGNQRLSKIIHSVADDYTSGDKARKSFLLSKLVEQVYEKSPHAGFVKKDPASGRWYAVEEALARTSAAQAVRDCLCSHYKSSRQFKQKRRRQAKKEQVPVHHIPCSAVPLTDMESNITMNGVASAKLSSGPSAAAMSLTSIPSFRRCVTSESSRPTACPSSSMQRTTDMFSILAANFCPQDTMIADPFEPVPIMERHQSPQERLSSILDSALDLDLGDYNNVYGSDDIMLQRNEQVAPAFVVSDDLFAEF